jgi:hypothetical protein
VLEPEWNDFDRLSPATKLLHNAKEEMEPRKTPGDLHVETVPWRELRRIECCATSAPMYCWSLVWTWSVAVAEDACLGFGSRSVNRKR